MVSVTPSQPYVESYNSKTPGAEFWQKALNSPEITVFFIGYINSESNTVYTHTLLLRPLSTSDDSFLLIFGIS